MIISRYLLKEILTTLLLIVVSLLLIQMANQFVLYLNNAASGGITLAAIFKLMLLQIPLYLSYLLPLGLFLSVLLSLGQLYVNQEMSVLFACGYSEAQLIKLVMWIALPIVFIIALVVFQLQPLIQKYQSEMKHGATTIFSVDKLFPKRFQDILQSGWVFYADEEAKEGGLSDIFLVRHYPANKDYPNGYWEVIRAEQLHQQSLENSKEEFAYLEKGTSYRGQAGEKNYRIIHFEQSALQLDAPTQMTVGDQKQAGFLSLGELWRTYDKNRANQVEFNWRLSIPVCVLILALWAVPLSYLNPRQGRYAKVFYACLVCLFYLNMMFASRGFSFSKKISPLVGIWWIHVFMLFLLLFFLLIRRNPDFFLFKLSRLKKS